MKPLLTILLALALLTIRVYPASPAPPDKPRLLILTDIGGDPDDQQSLIRLLLYANEFELEGLIATASGTPGELEEKITKAQLIREIVEAYGKVRPNLVRHAEGYPTAERLLTCVKSGNPNRGRESVGAGHDTEASRWIIDVVDRSDSRPLNVAIWGGQTDLAQALWCVRQSRGPAGLDAFIRKLRIYDIGDQDGLVDWIWQEFPGLFYVIGQAPPGRDKREAVYRGLYLGGDESLVARAWMEANIRQGHGPLGALYPPRTWTAPNPHSAIKEGDTPSWFFFLSNGLGDPDHPEWGGWGGRLTNAQARLFRDAHDTVGGVTDARCTVWRWREQFQNDFAARLDWCATGDPKKANHSPIAVLNGDTTKNVISLSTKPGETLRLSADGTRDPDGNAVELRWWIYREASTLRDEATRSFPKRVDLSATTGLTTTLVIPKVEKPATIHVILEARDNGTPKLWAYRRAVITIGSPVSRGPGTNGSGARSASMPVVIEP
jgi:hypothetical protein